MTALSPDHRRYLLVFGILSVILIIFPFALAKTSFFRRHSSYFYNPVIYDKYSIKGSDADILLVGDSALVTGVIPAFIEQETGWKTYNLGVPLSSFAAHEDLIVDNYLAQNKKPKLIVLYIAFGAQISNPDFDRTSLYEPAITLLWHDSLLRNLEFYGRYPPRVGALSATILRSFIGGFDVRSSSWIAICEQLSSGRGFVPSDIASHLAPLKPNQLTAADVTADRQYIAHFRQKYTNAGYRVLVAVSPVADCDPSFDNVIHSYSGLLDIQPYTLPCDRFSADGRYHMLRRGAEENSIKFSKILKNVLATNRHELR